MTYNQSFVDPPKSVDLCSAREVEDEGSQVDLVQGEWKMKEVKTTRRGSCLELVPNENTHRWRFSCINIIFCLT